mmetsp:Transcript_29398/g.50791  ORF Transcript_29398/g.50791 Transcript_29398/m.50791 type:complete len:86 (-) Transcript_29398:30-287(-)
MSLALFANEYVDTSLFDHVECITNIALSDYDSTLRIFLELGRHSEQVELLGFEDLAKCIVVDFDLNVLGRGERNGIRLRISFVQS